MQKYRLISKKGQGTFSQVLKAQSIKTGKFVAIKCMKNHFDSFQQVTNLREIQALKRLSPHPHIIRLLQVLYDQPTGRLALVFELMDMNMYEAIKGRRHYIPETRVKNYIYQLLKSIDHMHRNGIFHRDIKPQNLLIMEDCLKLADFGSCRGIFSHQPFTEYISTRWYRPPECLLTNGYYNYKMDMWGVGCVFFEVLSLFALFPGNNQVDQVKKIHNILGIPPQKVLDKLKNYPGQMQMDFQPQEGTGIQKLINHIKTPQCLDIIKKLLTYDADQRMTARQALAHPYFKDLRQKDKRQPKYPLYPPPVGLSYAKDQTAPSDNGSDGSFKMAKRSSQAAAAAAASKIGGLKDIHLPQQAGSKPRLSIGTSDDESQTDGRSLPPIKQYPGKIIKKAKGKQNGYNYKTNEYHYPIQMLKHNLSNQSLSKKSQSINEDLKIDKAKFFKKTFMQPQGYHGAGSSGQSQSNSSQPHRGYTKKKKPVYMI